MKYPVGIQTFSHIIEGDYVYVDKTDMVYKIATQGKIYFLNRPRRFGKSLLLSVFESYFLGRKELFKGLKIEGLEKEWRSYPVFRIDFNGGNFANCDELTKKLDAFITHYEAIYGNCDDSAQTLGDRFTTLLRKAHEQTGLPCVVLIDEYDKPLLDVIGLPDTVERNNVMVPLEDYNRDILKGFYSAFKLADADLRFVFLTGVTKFSQISVFSGFNQPLDISLSSEYATLCGMTDDEIEHYFHEPIQKMAESRHYSYAEMRDFLRQQYDGYHFAGNSVGVYNPYSLLCALRLDIISDHWFRTGSPSYLVRLLEKCNENLDQFTNKYFEQEEFEDYRADSQQPLPMIFQSGYLTIKAFNERKQKFMLDFPNNEVRRGFVALVANSYLKIKRAGTLVSDMVDALEDGDTEKFRTLFTSFLASIPYTVRRKEDERERERYFSYTLYLIFRIASCYATYAEKEQSQGRVDCVIETDKHVYIFEFKLDGTAAEALKQIDDKGYATEYLASGKHIHKIGLSISSATGTVEDWAAEAVGK